MRPTPPPHRLHRNAFRLALSLCAAALVACAHRPPIDYGPHGVITDPEIVFDAVQARGAKVRSVSGEARLSAELREGSGRVGQFVLAERPDRVRLETISFFGQPIAVLTSDGTTIHLHDLENGRFFEGPASAGNVSQLLPVRIPPQELVSLLLGVPPLVMDARPVSLRVDEEKREYVLTVRGRTPAGDSVLQYFGVDPATLRPTWVETSGRSGLDAYGATFRDYDGSELDLPRRISLVAIDGAERMELRFTDREVNVDIEFDAFTQEAPPGTEVLRP